MGLHLFSRRQFLAKKPKDVFTYELPRDVRVAVIHMWHEAIGAYQMGTLPNTESIYAFLERVLLKAHRLLRVGPEYDTAERIANYFLKLDDTNKAIDVMELMFRGIDRLLREVDPYMREYYQMKAMPDDAIAELNELFMEDGIGYQYENGNPPQTGCRFHALQRRARARHVLPGFFLRLSSSWRGLAERRGHDRSPFELDLINRDLEWCR